MKTDVEIRYEGQLIESTELSVVPRVGEIVQLASVRMDPKIVTDVSHYIGMSHTVTIVLGDLEN